MEPPLTSPLQIQRARDELVSGNTVVFPTETVYGIGANVFDPIAVAKIFEIKKRPALNPLIVHIRHLSQVETVSSEFPPVARLLAEHFWPGPLTLVLPKHPNVPSIVTSGLPTVGVRMPSHPVAQQLLDAVGFPLAAPSANLSGQLSPTRCEHAVAQLGNQVSIILEGGPCPIGIESTILLIEGDHVSCLRPGGIPIEQIEEHLKRRLARRKTDGKPLAPGMLEHHYAPQTPLLFLNPDEPVPAVEGKLGLLCMKKNGDSRTYASIEEISPSGDLRVAAANLFAALHRLDAMGLDHLVARAVPEVGLGCAINDRLKRAAS